MLPLRVIRKSPFHNFHKMTTTATYTSTSQASWFDQARFIPPDAIFALTAQFQADSFPQKVNLGQGTYRDANAKPWVLPSVNQAREALSAQGLQHEYLPILGLASFRERTARLVLGSDLFKEQESKVNTNNLGSRSRDITILIT